ncbi:hypothetical protein MBCUT_15610 [Methanobrevibacter cuticularis]|uniref:Uncharacterized protein n=1 Tax=Methanobrevibacter cuticularis TaxID=47311 RepID=A0A166CLW9_9EURY|nr:hypothetical protein [Methanobrevibacter cuticularis]KZX15347.1 hypothetical protein MBCUT_15610 [Methanobrevibacter cuticularis]
MKLSFRMDNIEKNYDYSKVSEDFYDIIPHKKAIEIANYEFFWDCVDELAPFGSDEGYIAFAELCDWVKDNPQVPLIDCFRWILKCWDLKLEEFNDDIIKNSSIIKIIQDLDFDQDLIMLDTTIIATGFGQLILQGKIDADIKNIIHLSILRQMNSNVLDAFLGSNEEWKYERYKYLQKLLEILEIA